MWLWFFGRKTTSSMLITWFIWSVIFILSLFAFVKYTDLTWDKIPGLGFPCAAVQQQVPNNSTSHKHFPSYPDTCQSNMPNSETDKPKPVPLTSAILFGLVLVSAIFFSTFTRAIAENARDSTLY